MKSSVLTTKGWARLIVGAVLVAAGTLNFAQRLTHTAPPTDGVDWSQTPGGIVASSVKADSAAGRKGVLGILPGDRLVAISLDEKEDQQVVTTYDIQDYLEEAGGGGRGRHPLERPASPQEGRLVYRYLVNPEPPQHPTPAAP